jgi:hypothetical protein
LNIIDLSGEKIEKVVNDFIITDVESVFSCRDKLFLGTPSALNIYSIENPVLPVYFSQLSHVYSRCNSIAVHKNLVYVSIYSENLCGQSSDQLTIFDINNAESPLKISSYPMKYPKGLGINKDKLFICDTGLKVFKIGEPETLMNNQLTYYKQVDAYDITFFNNIILLIADDGLYQYKYEDDFDFSAVGQLHLLSVIPRHK